MPEAARATLSVIAEFPAHFFLENLAIRQTGRCWSRCRTAGSSGSCLRPDRVRLAADGNREGRSVVAGEPFTETLVGPSAGAWRGAPGGTGRVAYILTDGGTAEPPDGVYRTAKVLRLELPPAA